MVIECPTVLADLEGCNTRARPGSGSAPPHRPAPAPRRPTATYAAATALPPPMQQRTTVQRKWAVKATPTRPARPSMDLRRFRLARGQGYAFPPPTPAGQTPTPPLTVPCTRWEHPLTSEWTASDRVEATTSAPYPPSCSVEMLFLFRDSIVRAARSAGPGISGLESNMI